MTATVATWFVADDAHNATFFPQVGARSDSTAAQATYWRCIVCFFASSLALNPSLRHVLYTNIAVPLVDGTDVAKLLAGWGVEVRTVPITRRLAAGSVGQWGNQFYVFDVIADHVSDPKAGPLLIVDSDCLWLRSADELLAQIERHGALSYWFNSGEYAPDALINGQTRAGLARFLAVQGGPQLAAVEYSGGELVAASAPLLRAIEQRLHQVWPAVMAQGGDAPREEAHLLSVLYAFEGIELGTANRFIRRMWTTFRHNTLRPSDKDLTIWHLPAEKRTGFRDLFAQIAARPGASPGDLAAQDVLGFANFARLMGFPRRSPGKFARDLALKLKEKIG